MDEQSSQTLKGYSLKQVVLPSPTIVLQLLYHSCEYLRILTFLDCPTPKTTLHGAPQHLIVPIPHNLKALEAVDAGGVELDRLQ